MRRSNTLLPWVVWGVAVFSYVVAVVNRSSLAALGPQAQSHFGIDATTLAMFPVIQLAVYAGMQIPVGMLLDRFGSSLMVLLGGAFMFIGQTLMATVTDLPLVVVARILVGAGDACVFVSVMKILPEWFAIRQIPTVSQLTGLLGQAGQLVSVIPLAIAVDRFGWRSGFLGIAAVALIAMILVIVVMRDSPRSQTIGERIIGKERVVEENALTKAAATGVVAAPPATSMLPVVRQRVDLFKMVQRSRQIISLPGVRLAFWMHFTSPFAMNVFVLLWGTPFLVGGLGVDPATAKGMLSLTIIASSFASLVLGPVSSRFMERRVAIYTGITIALAAVWTAVILWPGNPPIWLIFALLIIMPIGGPASMLAFEVQRSHTPKSFVGFGTGLVNTGGFIASLIAIYLIGLVLDLEGAGTPETYSLDAFKLAFAVQIPIWLFGLGMVFLETRRTKGWMRRHDRKLR
ncbi:MFS transporter [Leucobacter sp. cx-42]|uniref:MFS transporter n=1 Tax=unclassified Leucobacter TaxID=2621730 RepID=UPI00165E9DFC|nr:MULTISPECIES: MFS transporter [unclassified Leucobacter]MBC9953188.1 MFS transporter [Leucobacter sp. cx-42]